MPPKKASRRQQFGRPGNGPLELPDGFITYALPENAPPTKRQKTAPEPPVDLTNGSGAQEQKKKVMPEALDYIVVGEYTWEVKCNSSKLRDIETPLERTNAKTYISWDQARPRYISFLYGKDGTSMTFDFPEDIYNTNKDIRLALDIHRQASKWSKDQGRLWTEFGFVLLQREGVDYIQITFTIKWNITNSIYTIPKANQKIEPLKRVLAAYFPDANLAQSETWTAQDFYQSVHTPAKDDELAATIEADISSNLFPFQKRAVRWLLRREGVDWNGSFIQPRDPADFQQESWPHGFQKRKDSRGRPCFVSALYGCTTVDLQPFHDVGQSLQELRGGILAEEMGLGKTLETIALISLHRRPPSGQTVQDPYTLTEVRPIGTTLIVCPGTLVQQWISEIKKHSNLKVMHYEGIGVCKYTNVTSEELREDFEDSDVVVTTYSVLAGEINYTFLNPEKSLRREAKYQRPKSPLVDVSWWRICIDEAQMVESGVSNAATVARIIPRINAWCITGTPVRRDINDLLGLFIFLRIEPYSSARHVWSSLVSTHKPEFRRLFGYLALRHSKKSVRDEIKLPTQKRYVMTMPFTPIEEQHYQELFNQMCKEANLDTDGQPAIDDWDPNVAAEPMRQWLIRLRQTCVHPEVGERNRRALGRKDGPLRTVDEVLDVMMDQTDTTIRGEQRQLIYSRLKRGQLFENSPRVKEALEIWDGAAREASVIVEECREALRNELAKVSAGSDMDLDGSEEESKKLSVFRNRLRSALEIEHMAIFFRANAYFQIKSNEEMTKPESPEFKALEKQELEGYEHAKKLRREILQEIFGKAEGLMNTVSQMAHTQSFAEIPEFKTDARNAGLESRRIVEQLERLATALDAQANTLDEWRERTVQLLLRPLVDEDEEVEITGEEYEESTKNQDEIFCYVQALRSVIADRHCTLTGQESELLDYETRTALRLAKEGEGPFPQKTLELHEIRKELKTPPHLGSIRGIVAELRALATSMRPEEGTGSARVLHELSIVESQLRQTQKQLTQQSKGVIALEKDLELFTSVMNTRLEYYRQLQQVSDSVAPYEGPISDQVANAMLATEAKLMQKIATAKAKRRYLEHLRQETSDPQEQRLCVICRETFEVGAITVCGHQYCKECIGEWWQSHRTCPVCKRKISLNDLHDITYKPQELSIETEDMRDGLLERHLPSSATRKSAIYSEISKTQLAEINNIELDGPSFTTKINTLARHLLWLRETDPGAKSIIYSQFKDFLTMIAYAFRQFRIGYSSISMPDGTEKFKSDPSIECFLLHARAHASGLNLVNANHVFLCEPLLNTALELQAIARVDRIGQQQETNVWLYLISGTVEESIYQLSVQRRMEHIGQARGRGKGKLKETTPEEILDSNLEEANSLELQQAPLNRLMSKGEENGEMVAQDDLWDCLFGARAVKSRATVERSDDDNDNDGTNGDDGARGAGGQAMDEHELRNDPEVRRHLAAEAASQRLAHHPRGHE